jgi:carbamoyl-phosphate synthase large subunit
MKKNILVTGVGGRSVGSGIVHALCRSPSALPNTWNVVGADADPFSWGLYITPQATLLPLAGAPDYLSAVQKAIGHFHIDAIIPGTEAEAERLTRDQSQLPIPVIANSPSIIPLMMDKRLTEQRLLELGLPFIPSYTLEQSAIAISTHGFPLIAKPSVGTGGSRGLSILMDQSELDRYLAQVNPMTQPMLQPYLGSPEEEYTVGVLSTPSGQLIDTIIMRRKLMGLSLLDARQSPTQRVAISTGYSQGFFVEDEEVRIFCENLSIALDSRGPLNLQLRRHAGKLYVFEIHPRFSGTTTMRADAGFNEPDILLRHQLFGETFGRLGHQTNVAVIRAFEHVLVPIDQMLKP